MTGMKRLISKTEYILKHARAEFRNPAVMWSTGKDSTTMLSLIRDTFLGRVPFPVIHLDTGRKFPEIYGYRDRMAKKWNLNLIVGKNTEALRKGMSPEKHGHLACCNALKTEALKQVLQEHGFDALIMSIRRDEHYVRNLERFFSPRDSEFKWHIVRPKKPGETGDAPFEPLQQAELWDLYQTDFGPGCSHVRVHPILHWTELDVWDYIREKGLPMNPLYFSRNGHRYRSLGCMGCTTPIESAASNVEEIIEELKTANEPERAGRSQDKESEDTMRKLRALGYM
jgi:sulfate adenylyltransferase subunit 2